MGISDHLICLLRNLYAGEEAIVRAWHGTTDWFQIGKGVHQGCVLSPCLFNFYSEYIMWNARLDEAQAGIKIAGIKVYTVKAMVFPVVMYGCESWSIKMAECWGIYAFELWCWRRLLRVPWTIRRANQPILKEINPEYSLEGLMLKLKYQYFSHLIQRANSL